MELGRFWDLTDISVLAPKTASQPLDTQSTIKTKIKSLSKIFIEK